MNDYPIILAHGIARFDFLIQRFAKHLNAFGIDFEPASDGLHYFKGIARRLRENGFDVFQSSVGFAAGVERRAADLKREIETALAVRPNQTKVHIIAHSMGGLDARHMIVDLEMAERVASLTTVGTPHLGTSFADWGIANGGDLLLETAGKVIDLGGFADLTGAACREFNAEAEASEAANAVVYKTYCSSESREKIFAPLQSAWDIINLAEGDNDGLVSRRSQQWTSELRGAGGVIKNVEQRVFPVAADHLNEIGWWDLNQIRLEDFVNLARAVSNYEDQIKNVYLEIARAAQTLPAGN